MTVPPAPGPSRSPIPGGPKPVSGIKPVPMATNPYTTQGMISPATPFVDPATGMLMPVSFRFLYGLFAAITQLEAANAALQQRLTQAGL